MGDFVNKIRVETIQNYDVNITKQITITFFYTFMANTLVPSTNANNLDDYSTFEIYCKKDNQKEETLLLKKPFSIGDYKSSVHHVSLNFSEFKNSDGSLFFQNGHTYSISFFINNVFKLKTDNEDGWQVGVIGGDSNKFYCVPTPVININSQSTENIIDDMDITGVIWIGDNTTNNKYEKGIAELFINLKNKYKQTVYKKEILTREFPYLYVIPDVPSGEYYLDVNGTDEYGLQFKSSTLYIKVNEPKVEINDSFTKDFTIENDYKNGVIHLSITFNDIPLENDCEFYIYKRLKTQNKQVQEYNARQILAIITYTKLMGYETLNCELTDDIVENDNIYSYELWQKDSKNGWGRICKKEVLCNYESNFLVIKGNGEKQISLNCNNKITADMDLHKIINTCINSQYPYITNMSNALYRNGTLSVCCLDVTECNSMTNKKNLLYKQLLLNCIVNSDYMLLRTHSDGTLIISATDKISDNEAYDGLAREISFSWTEIANSHNLIDLVNCGILSIPASDDWLIKYLDGSDLQNV